MRESRTYGFVRGPHSNMRPYRDPYILPIWSPFRETRRDVALPDRQMTFPRFSAVAESGITNSTLRSHYRGWHGRAI